MPQELGRLTRRVLQLEIEETAFKQERTIVESATGSLSKELADVRETLAPCVPNGKTSKGIDDVRVLREQIESTRVEMEKAERAYDLNLVAELAAWKDA